MGWVHASERLSLLHLGKASRGNAKVKTGIGKSDLPGLQGGPRKRDLVGYDSVRASRFYPDVSGRQGCESRRGKVLPPSIACYGRQAYPMHAKVTMHVLLGCKSHGCPASF